MNRMRYACVALLAGLCALAVGCNMSLFSDRHYHYHDKCGPRCRRSERHQEPGPARKAGAPERTGEE